MIPGVLALTGIVLSGVAFAVDDPPFAVEELRSGYEFARPETRAIQDDDFANPGLFWVESGEQLWTTPDGPDRKACTSCHGDAAATMADAARTFPKIDRESGSLVNLEQRINLCRTRQMNAPAFEQESDDLLGLSAYVSRQGIGRPLSVRVDGPARAWFERGRDLYRERVGQMNLACTQCHDQRTDLLLRAERISQGHVNGFPTYLLRWGRLASVHRRFQFCNEQARAEPLALGSDDYNALQLYVAWRGNGLLLESPAVRR